MLGVVHYHFYGMDFVEILLKAMRKHSGEDEAEVDNLEVLGNKNKLAKAETLAGPWNNQQIFA